MVYLTCFRFVVMVCLTCFRFVLMVYANCFRLVLMLSVNCFRFVQYTAMIGGLSGTDQCVIPDSSDHNVYLQYSVDGGQCIAILC